MTTSINLLDIRLAGLPFDLTPPVTVNIADIGVEWTLAPSLMHYTLADDGRMHHTLLENHLHYTLPPGG